MNLRWFGTPVRFILPFSRLKQVRHALDFGNLYQLVNGSGDPNVNLEQGRLNPAYKQIAEIGAKYNWYNPWRLSDFVGIAECWHFEYWGPVAGGYASVHKSNT